MERVHAYTDHGRITGAASGRYLYACAKTVIVGFHWPAIALDPRFLLDRVLGVAPDWSRIGHKLDALDR